MNSTDTHKRLSWDWNFSEASYAADFADEMRAEGWLDVRVYPEADHWKVSTAGLGCQKAAI